ncbi:MAG: mismatch repair protein [Acidobacteriaceae bacterium]|nr:mismatch repair protein [Acidobacteriaceae bacterium]
MHPLEEYTSRRERWLAVEQRAQKLFVQIGNWRLLVAVIAALLAWLSLGRHVAPATLLLPLAAFILLVVWHQRVIRRRTCAQRAIRFYDDGLARLRDHWSGQGIAGLQYRDPAHIYSEDLDVFGKGSLFELIARTRTTSGEGLLARWLLRPADRADAIARQAAVTELRRKLDLREEIALLGEDIRSGVKTQSITGWGAAPDVVFHPALRSLCLVLSVSGAVFLIGFFANWLPLWPLLVIVACNFVLMFALRTRVSSILAGVESSGRDLTILSLMVKRLEMEEFESDRLRLLSANLEISGLTASRRIAKLGRLIEFLDSSDHILVRAVRPLILWNEQLAMALEAWRRESGRHVGGWIGTMAEFEALSSLASIAFERPQWSFPKLTECSSGEFHAEALQHPLLAPAECVPNDVSLGDGGRLLIVSGSNMSGKSTLLRSIGLNAVLAWAGAPVAAANLTISPLHVGASIRVTDSLQEHRSRFFAEITRIRQIVDLTHRGPPVLFLLDELLSGTNSHDRRVGAAGIVHGLLKAGAIGLVTTHDLALTNLDEDETVGISNVHFEDRIVNGEMRFDYKLRPGVVQRSNALELMRAVGLEV